jgi:DNA polymerase-3 subunit beta
MIDTDISVGTGLKLNCSRDALATTLSLVTRAVSSRATVQILSGVLLRAEPDRLALSATDMEISLRSHLPATVAEAGTTVVPGRVLLDAVKALPATDDVLLEQKTSEGTLELRCGNAVYRLHTFSTEDFPRLPELEEGARLVVPRDALLETIARVARSASRDESRPVLTGILVRFEAGKLVMAATDSYRLAVRERPLETPVGELEAIVPARALAELARFAEGESIELVLRENYIGFASGNAFLTSRRIDGQFPNYRQLLPETFEHIVRLPRAEFGDVVRRVGIMAQRNSPLRLSFGDGTLTVSARTQDVGEAKETLPVAFSGEAFEIGFNAEFLRDGIDSVLGDELELKLISPLRPGLLSCEGDAFWYLIMPIRLAG